ncbi:dTDP-4-dehydrorhamnose 3,5-epimerase [Marinicrinis sediminis]|uniref:dTDP-4-dehydrorhamnose 3,5-epimerase n=1 Tax=Marinicrinis sediminis TaxID=1652465 RepID=A0ABW5RDP1_9BACL
MKIETLSIEGLCVIEPALHLDARGFFMESYHADKWQEAGMTGRFIQDNHSYSERAGTLRGLHFQSEPYAQTKLVRVISGAIYDVAVDLRPDSRTYGKWEGIVLSAQNRKQLLIPKGFAHGFCTLSDHTEVLYKVDAYYAPESDSGILWNDEELGIDWPCTNPILSSKDQQLPPLSQVKQAARKECKV